MPHVTLEEDTILTKVLDVLSEREQVAAESLLDPQIIPDHSKMSMYAGRCATYREAIRLIHEIWEETIQMTYEKEDEEWT